MAWTPEQGPVSAALALETVRAWTLELTTGERGRMPQVPRRAARRRAWASRRGWRSPSARNNGWPGAAVHGEAPP
jgi:hypothetical protein